MQYHQCNHSTVHLRKAPILTTLELIGFTFLLDEWDTLHQNTPLLTKLTLINIQLISSTSKIRANSNIIPNTTIETLKISRVAENGASFPMQIDLARYITKKNTSIWFILPLSLSNKMISLHCQFKKRVDMTYF